MAKFLLPMLPCLFRGTKLPNVLLCSLPFLKYFLNLGLRLSLKRDATKELCPFVTTIIKRSFTIVFCHLVHRSCQKTLQQSLSCSLKLFVRSQLSGLQAYLNRDSLAKSTADAAKVKACLYSVHVHGRQ
jgi:hypothetical protein